MKWTYGQIRVEFLPISFETELLQLFEDDLASFVIASKDKRE